MIPIKDKYFPNLLLDFLHTTNFIIYYFSSNPLLIFLFTISLQIHSMSSDSKWVVWSTSSLIIYF